VDRVREGARLMQLGTRWALGATPPDRLPAAMVEAVAEVEAELVDADTADWRWTLTWLEGRPVVELDDGTTLRYNPGDDRVTVASDGDGDGYE
jgi:hypothetical protein